MSIDESVQQYNSSEQQPDYVFSWDSHYQIIQCQDCKIISFRRTSSNSEEEMQISGNDWDSMVHEKLYPSRIERGKEIETWYLPSKIRRIYTETLQALHNQSPVLAGIGLRALVETVCKEKTAKGSDLHKKIDYLVAKQILTPTDATILQKIRTLGNKAAHEVKPHSDKQLGFAMDVIEHLLQAIYILPKQVRSEFDNE